MLADLINLGLLAKQAHWNVTGPNFRSLHLQLDEIADLARGFSDQVAERAAAIGFNPDGRAATVAGASTLPDIEHGDIEDGAVVEIISDALLILIRTLRGTVSETAQTDLVSQGLLIEITAAIEKQYWLFQAQH
ncbi:DNA starvation/stationary phase protection protein [Micromonospora sp. GCM10011541]|uniref:Dps family protein n=1 Tax=Micromonospora TaxID=1873 RepID=UPI00360F9828